MSDNLQVVVFIPDSKENTSVISITRYDRYVQIKQGDMILGSIALSDELYQFKNPMAVITITNGIDVKLMEKYGKRKDTSE